MASLLTTSMLFVIVAPPAKRKMGCVSPTVPSRFSMVPDVLGEQFYDMLVELRAYKYAKGHCNVL
jgi:hypothetical protein